MSKQITFFNKVSAFELLSHIFKTILCVLAIVKLIIIAGFQVGSEDTFWVEILITCKYFKGDIEILHFVIAKSNIDINCLEFSSFQEQFFIYLSCFFVMSSQVVNGSE